MRSGAQTKQARSRGVRRRGSTVMKLFGGDLVGAAAPVVPFFVTGPPERSLGSVRAPSAIVIGDRGALR